jgi:ribosomal-protein-serine acetyltransferase
MAAFFTQRVDEDLELAVWEQRHAAEAFAAIDANREYLRRWLPWLDDLRTVDDERAFIRRAAEQAARNDGFQAAICHRGQLVGGVGFHYVNWPNRKTEIGYWLAESAQGRGVMTRCCRALVDHAFAGWGLNRVVIFCATDNHRSRAVPERLGFTHEGTYRQAEWLYDHFVDLEGYAMLASDWEAGRETVEDRR